MTDLELRLIDLGEHLDVPPGDGLAAAVVARVGVGRPTWWRRWWRWIAGGVAVAALGAGVSPAVADLLGVGGIAVHLDDAPTTSHPSPRVLPPPVTPEFGRAITLGEVPAAAGFAPLLPTVLGRPGEVFVNGRGLVPIVSLRWTGGPLLTELKGGMPSTPVLQKFAARAAVRWVRVDGRPALWIAGVHEIVMSEVEGGVVMQRLRTADSTLLIEIGGVTVSIETTLGLEEAMRIAGSLRGT